MSPPKRREWDRLVEIEEPMSSDVKMAEVPGIPALGLMAAGLAELVVVLALTTALVVGLSFHSLPIRIQILYWALPVAFFWWLMAAAICLRVLKASPGMLIAGLSFSSEIRGNRLVMTMIAAVFGAACLGIPLLFGGAEKSILSRAADSTLQKRFFA